MRKKILRNFLCFLAMYLLTVSTSWAQNQVTGRVVDAGTRAPIPNASITIKGTTTGTVSNNDGTFSLNVPGTSTLEISFVGYVSRDVDVSGRTSLGDIALTASNESLNEVVVVGYTTQLKKDITGSVSVVNIGDMIKQPTGLLANQLQGQASGVTVLSSGQPGDQPIVSIRGLNTFGNNVPLYIVDGVPTQNISTLNPNDVQSLQVLKDAGAASIYGSRASNGVIIITTKQGRGKTTITYDGYYGTQRPKGGNVWNLLSPMEEAQLKFMALKNSGTPVSPSSPDALYGSGPEPVLPDYLNPIGAKDGDPSVNPNLYFVDPFYTNPDELNRFYRITKANKQGTDWFHEVFKPASMQNHNISVSGSSDLGRFFISGEYLDQNGTSLYTYLKRYTLRANTQFNLGNRVRVGENMAYSISEGYRINPDEDSQTGMAFRESTIIPVFDIMGNYAGTYGGKIGNSRNPVGQAWRRAYNNSGMDNRLFGNIFADVDVLNSVTFHTSFGGESLAGTNHSFGLPEYENAENTSKNSYSEGSYYNFNWTWTNTLQYKQTFGKHDISALVGVESFKANARSLSGNTQSYFTFDPNFVNLSTGSGTQSNASSKAMIETLWSQFGRIDYAYNSRYLLSATLRRDGSSKFISSNSFGFFPAVTVGWRISQEDFMKSADWITDLKIRGGFGVMGNQFNIISENAFTTFSSNRDFSYYDIGGTNNSIVQGFGAGNIGNPAAKWEKDNNTNIGFDATLFQGKLTATVDWYKKSITDLLFNPALPATAGNGTAPFVNVASMTNTGLDLQIGTHQTFGSGWTFDATGVFTTYNNKIKKVTGNTDFFMSGSDQGSRFGDDFVRNQVGHSIGQFYGYQIVGFWNTQQEIDDANTKAQHAVNDPEAVYQNDIGLGRFRYQDTNGDGIVTDEDRTLIGNPNPDFTYGLNLGSSYKNFDLSLFLFGSKGNDIWNNVKWYNDFWASFVGAKSKTALYDSWTPENHNAKAPIQENKGFTSTNGVPNSYYIEKGSYMKLKNITLGYTFPENMLKKAFIQSLRVYVQGANLVTFTNYSGADPEVSSAQVDNSTSFGIDEGVYPTPRTFIVGINLKF